jgi:catechol 2,3-dioxygenase-like lactoylglutathione lyase family enzyme
MKTHAAIRPWTLALYLYLALVITLTLGAVASAQTRPAITSISHLSVYTSDAARTERFYVHDLGGFKASDPQSPAGVRYYFNPIQFVEVLPLPAGQTSINRIDHVAYNTSDAEALRKYLAAHGLAVPSAVTSGSDGSRYFVVQDPEGNGVELVQPPAHPAPVPKNPLSTHVIHMGYLVHDASVEDRFYQSLLGFRPYWHGGMKDDATDWISQQVPDGTDWFEYMLVKGPEKTGIPTSMSQDALGVLDHFSLGVPNMEKAVTLLYEGDRISGKHSWAQIGRDGKWQFNLYDPDGIRVELMEFQPAGKPCCSPFLLPSPKE